MNWPDLGLMLDPMPAGRHLQPHGTGLALLSLGHACVMCRFMQLKCLHISVDWGRACWVRQWCLPGQPFTEGRFLSRALCSRTSVTVHSTVRNEDSISND